MWLWLASRSAAIFARMDRAMRNKDGETKMSIKRGDELDRERRSGTWIPLHEMFMYQVRAFGKGFIFGFATAFVMEAVNLLMIVITQK
jgi:hypothetical protein